ncbi:MAG: hypothetical protein JW841_07435 [Deltaproteobacteria bacterium]|nr:hypothetical protein [Deltaproteobacteria bacterium]
MKLIEDFLGQQFNAKLGFDFYTPLCSQEEIRVISFILMQAILGMNQTRKR